MTKLGKRETMTRLSKRQRASVQQQCSHRSDSECTCGAFVAVDRVALWDAIHRYVIACGGDPSKHVYGNTPRMQAVCDVENTVVDRQPITGEIGRWISERPTKPTRARP